MNKKIIIFIVSILFFLLFLGILEFVGIKKEVCFEEANCKKCYLDYILYPHLYDYYDCRCNSFLSSCFKRPCGLDLNLERHNTQADLIQCLCQDKLNNAEKIVDFYNNKFGPRQSSTDVNFICREGARESGRL